MQTVRVQTIIGPDLQGDGILYDIQNTLKNKHVTQVKTARVYRLEGISEKETIVLAEKLFSEPINQHYSLNKPILKDANNTIEIAYKSGVMNPEVASITKAAEDLGIKLVAADSSWEYGFYGKVLQNEVVDIIEKLRLFNPLIEHIVTTEPTTLLISGAIGKTTTIPLRSMNEPELLWLSKDTLFLNVEEMKIIQAYFQKIKKNPTDIEIETIAQTWSEHCAHKTFKANLVVEDKSLPAGRQEKEPLINRIKKEALKHKKHIVSAFVDNSGVMDFYDGFAINGKVETHNSPSAIEPYGGAMTGVGGVFRDVLGTGHGAKPIASVDIFCFAPLDINPKKLPKGSLPPLYLLKNVVKGVKDYGNRMGIPTNNGSVHFHEDFRAKPTVIVGSYGILPKKKAQKGTPKTGDLIIVVGGRTGRDGVHGATFSSAEMTEKTSTINATAVQIGNAIEEKRILDALLEARDKNLIRAIQDCGAGGFSSAIGEMGENTGVTVHLEKALLKYPGLAPWEIWVSESQERMIVAIPKEKLEAFLAVCKKYNTEPAVLGTFDNDKKLKIFFEKKLICNLDMDFLHNGLPQRTMIANRNTKYQIPNTKLPKIPKIQNEWITILEKVLSHGNICSKEPIVRRYDHTVQGTNTLQPYSGELLDGPNDAAVIRPLLGKTYGMIVSHGLNPVLNSIDPYWGSIWASTEAIANYTAVGGNYKNASLINNYVWPFPDEQSLWSLDKSVDAVVDFMKTLKIPVISGKDSLSSTYRGRDGTIIAIPPVLCMSVFGKIPDVKKTISSDFKKEGSSICLVGKMDFLGMAGSVYFDVQNTSGTSIPKVDLKILPDVLDTLHTAIQKGEILSAHDISEGGLITAVFEMCVGGNMGARISLDVILNSFQDLRLDYALFNETAGCFVVEIEDEKTAHALFKNVPHSILGKTQREQKLDVLQEKEKLFSTEVFLLKEAWQKPMKEIFG